MTVGEFNNVILSEEQHIRLLTRFGPSVTKDYIDRLSGWFADHPRKAKASRSHYARILAWVRKDRTLEAYNEPINDSGKESAPLIEEAELRERAEIMFSIRMNELNAWIADAQKHVCRCHGGFCRYAAEKEPKVPSLEQIVARLRESE